MTFMLDTNHHVALVLDFMILLFHIQAQRAQMDQIVEKELTAAESLCTTADGWTANNK